MVLGGGVVFRSFLGFAVVFRGVFVGIMCSIVLIGSTSIFVLDFERLRRLEREVGWNGIENFLYGYRV